MGQQTGISWTDSTFNPWIGCSKVSPGCEHCYAEHSTPARTLRVEWGTKSERRRTSPSNWLLPEKWNYHQFWQCSKCGWRGGDDERIDSPYLLCGSCKAEALEPARRRVFCASLADVFDNQAPDAWRHDLFKLIAETPNLDWLLLTKRIGNAPDMLPSDWNDLRGYNNVWLGASITTQVEAERDIAKLLAVQARVRFLSIEPLLEPIKLPRVDFHCDLCGGTGILARWPKGKCHDCKGLGKIPAISTDPKFGTPAIPMRFIDWVIVGGESGTHARPMCPAWAEDIREQCRVSNVPFFFKQNGGKDKAKGGIELNGSIHQAWPLIDQLGHAIR